MVAALVDARADSWSLVVSSTMLGVRAGGVALVVVVLVGSAVGVVATARDWGWWLPSSTQGLRVVVASIILRAGDGHHHRRWSLVAAIGRLRLRRRRRRHRQDRVKPQYSAVRAQVVGVMGPVVYDTGRSVVIVHHVVKYTEGCRYRRLVVAVTVVVGGAGGRPVVIVSLWHLPWSSSAR